MKTIYMSTIDLIESELINIPEKYANKDFASTHEALAVIREEYLELEKEVFWGEKKALKKYDQPLIQDMAVKEHKDRMKAEAVQLAAMCVRFIQECC
jgi:hypothetical protein